MWSQRKRNVPKQVYYPLLHIVFENKLSRTLYWKFLQSNVLKSTNSANVEMITWLFQWQVHVKPFGLSVVSKPVTGRSTPRLQLFTSDMQMSLLTMLSFLVVSDNHVCDRPSQWMKPETKTDSRVFHSLYKVGRNGNFIFKGFNNSKKKLPPVGLDQMLQIITGLGVQCLTR